MRIAILYICTGRYSIFWKDFFISCEKYFVPTYEKHYFVFTDDKKICIFNDRVHYIHQDNLGWPDVATKRYHILVTIKEQLQVFDYIFFFNANARFCRPIDASYLPDTESPFVFQQHPGFYNKPSWRFPFEQNPLSQAYIARRHASYYLASGINGALCDAYLDMIESIKKAVDVDLQHGLVARWHDESHLNKFAIGKSFKLWHPGFATPDGRNLPFPRMIRLVDKRSVGGHEFMRGICGEKAKTFKDRFIYRPSFPKIPAEGEQPFVVARLRGGLGNQMFIYAAAYALARRLGAELHIDAGALQSDKIRRYELYRFGLMDPQWRVPKGCDTLIKMWNCLRASFGRSDVWTCLTCPPAYRPCLEQATGSCYMTGYWQSPKYFASYAGEIRALFTAPMSEDTSIKELQAYIASAPTVAVHLRRGDYTHPKNLAMHGLLPSAYYEAARKHIEMYVPEGQYLVFSDEPDVASEMFRHWSHCRIAHCQNHVDALMLMRSCRHAIIANSSFSWWGAWLGQSEGQIVVAPRQWFAPAVNPPFAVEDLFPEGWTAL